jgi:hypothetical protein
MNVPFVVVVILAVVVVVVVVVQGVVVVVVAVAVVVAVVVAFTFRFIGLTGLVFTMGVMDDEDGINDDTMAMMGMLYLTLHLLNK